MASSMSDRVETVKCDTGKVCQNRDCHLFGPQDHWTGRLLRMNVLNKSYLSNRPGNAAKTNKQTKQCKYAPIRGICTDKGQFSNQSQSISVLCAHFNSISSQVRSLTDHRAIDDHLCVRIKVEKTIGFAFGIKRSGKRNGKREKQSVAKISLIRLRHQNDRWPTCIDQRQNGVNGDECDFDHKQFPSFDLDAAMLEVPTGVMETDRIQIDPNSANCCKMTNPPMTECGLREGKRSQIKASDRINFVIADGNNFWATSWHWTTSQIGSQMHVWYG